MPKRKLLSLLLMLCITAMLAAACSLPGVSRSITADPKETVTKGYQKLNSLKNYHMSMELKTSMSLQGKNINSVMNSDTDVQKNPMVCKNTYHIISDIDAKRTEQTMVQYIEESGDQFAVYSNIRNQWIKQTIPKDGFNPVNDYEEHIKAITSVVLKNEDAATAVFDVVADGNALRGQIQRNLAAIGIQKSNISNDLFKDIGDLKYSVTIDKKTATVCKIDMDLSDIMAKIGSNIAVSNEIPEAQKEFIKDMFDDMSIKSSVAFSQLNGVDKIVVPEEAKK